MKPSFTLNFTDDSIQLLHRTGKGWVVVGETPFAAPDLDDALDYMRKTALGLEPGGFTTQLVIPNSQIKYLELEAPGPDPDTKRAEIQAALVGKTPYAPEDLVFDWSGKGKDVRVAVLARETLQEAEGFATAHKFNPVGFTAIPENGTFAGGPWFGETEQAASLLPQGEKVDRDRGALVILSRDLPKPSPVPQPDSQPDPQPQLEPEPELSLESAPVPAPAVAPERVAETTAKPQPDPAPMPQAAPAEQPAQQPAAAAAADLQHETIHAPAAPASDRPAPAAFPAATATPLPTAPAPTAPAAADAAKPSPAADDMTPSPMGAAPAAPASTLAPAEAPAADDEAPFTHVTETSAFPEDEDVAVSAPQQAPAKAPPPPVAPPAAPRVDDDIPPAPSSAAMVAFASRRGADAASRAPALGVAARPDPAALARAARGKPVEELPPMPRPPQAAARPSGEAAGGLRGNVARGLGSLVAAPGLGGARKAKVKPGPLPPPPAKAQTQVAPSAGADGEAAKSLTRPGGTFGNRPPPRPKSRAVLFLSLVAVLLLCLALVAAWSSYYLSARTNDLAAPAVASAEAGADLPAIEDEMLADGEGDLTGSDGAAADLTEADPDPAATDVAAADPADDLAAPVSAPEAAPDTALASDSPTTQPQPETQDEIFLATSESAPPALDALSLPPPETSGDALPAPQMPPPPFGTVYAFDENGLLKPTPEGIVSPEGVLLIAGKPPVLPPSRSEAAAQAAAAALAAVPTEPAAPQTDGLVEALGVGEVAPLDPAAQPDPDLADRRPLPRPDGLAPDPAADPTANPAANPDDATLLADPETRVTSLRPRSRPGVVLAAGERARQETEAASLATATQTPAAEVPAAEAEAQLAAATAAEAANPSVVAISRRPAERPKDFNRAVEAAVAAAIRAPTPKPEPEPAPEKTAKKAPAPDVKSDEQSEIDEPEVAATAMPKVPTKASVAKQATYKNAINLSKTNLIGVYGTPSKRYALIRQANGKYKKVTVGDKVDGGKVQAITESEVRYQKGGRLIALKMPKG